MIWPLRFPLPFELSPKQIRFDTSFEHIRPVNQKFLDDNDRNYQNRKLF